MTRRELSPRDAVNRWLDSIRLDRSDETLSTYWYRLKLFVEWCEDQGVESMDAVDGFVLDEYIAHRRSVGPTTNTLKNESTTLKNFVEYCEGLGVVEGEIHDSIDVPTVPREEQSSNIKLAAEDARALIEYYRDEPKWYGSRRHALLEVLWHSGARVGEIHALDLDDLEQLPDGTRYLVFRNRAESGTRLKKGPRGERPIRFGDEVWAVFDHYVEHSRIDTTDDYGRDPLFTSNQGRASRNALRQWTYRATVPCVHSPCPHDKDPQTCEHLEHNSSSGCPSSRSPHQIRTGAITWLRDQGYGEDEVAQRVNASVETIRDHYDKQDPIEEMLRRRDDLSTLDITGEDEDAGEDRADDYNGDTTQEDDTNDQ
jgi:site-specific recombinase XerD